MKLVEGVNRWKETGGILLDVRDKEDYDASHIPGSVNVPVTQIIDVLDLVENHSTAIYIYCYMGRRSMMAEHFLHSHGYDNAISIGGMDEWSGEIEK